MPSECRGGSICFRAAAPLRTPLSRALGEPVFLEVGVDDGEQLALVLERQLLHQLKAPKDPPAGLRADAAGPGRLLADELVDGDRERVGELGEDVARGQCAAGLVVGDHALGHLADAAELALRERSGASEGGEALSEVGVIRQGRTRHGKGSASALGGLQERVDGAKQRVLIALGELVDEDEPAQETSTLHDPLGWLGAVQSEQLVRGSSESEGEAQDDVAIGAESIALVVGDQSLNEPGLFCQLDLSEAPVLSKTSEADPERLAIWREGLGDQLGAGRHVRWKIRGWP